MQEQVNMRIDRVRDPGTGLGDSVTMNQHLAGTDDLSTFDVKQSCRVEHHGFWLRLRVYEPRYDQGKDQN